MPPSAKNGGDAALDEGTQAVVLCDVWGPGLAPLAARDSPAALLPVAGVPAIEYTLQFLADGGVAEVLAAPRSHFGARIAGLNLVRGVLTGTGTLAAAAGQSWHGIAAEPLATGQEAVAVFSPAAVSVFREQPHGSPRNSVRGPIVGIEAAGPVVRVRLEDQSDATPGLAADISTEAMADLRLGVGDIVWLTVKAQAVLVHAAARAPS